VTAVEIWNSERGHFSVSSTDCMCLAWFSRHSFYPKQH
jgi:hypothetical protein